MADILVTGIRFALYADLLLLTGLAAFPLHALDDSERHDVSRAVVFARAQRWLCGSGLLLSAIGMIVLTAEMQGVEPLSVDPAMLLTMIGDTDVGTAWTYRMVALIAAAGALWRMTDHPVIGAWTVAVSGAIAIATLAWSGHAAASEGLAGIIHRISDALHMIAAAIWLGAIAAFLILLRPRRDQAAADPALLAARSLDRFARVGTISVLIIAATGLINAELIFGIGNAARLLASPYGQLLLVKLLLFGAMLILAGLNRWRLTPALTASLVEGETGVALGAMRYSVLIEVLMGVVILALVAVFGTLQPLP